VHTPRVGQSRHRARPVRRRRDQAFKKRQTWGVWNRYFLTNLGARMARPLSRLFVAVGLTPNAVSVLSFLVSLTGMVAVVAGATDPAVAAGGAGLLMLGLVLDHADGQVARSTGKMSAGGALFDTILDRWIEMGWILALAAGTYLNGTQGGFGTEPVWLAAAAAAWAVHSTLYVRWANIQRDLYVIQKELKQAKRAAGEATEVVVDASPMPEKFPEARTFYIPFAFNRDATLWMLFVVTLLPNWAVGLLVFALLHTLLGLEKNWYTYQDLRRDETTAIRAILDPDYHR
jgi:phosphatidylglycerophosphate synthase